MNFSHRSLVLPAALIAAVLGLAACTNIKEMIGKVDSKGAVRATELDAVAVLPFEGPHGNIMADRVSYELLDRGAAVVTRQKINRVLNEQNLADAGFNPSRDRAKLDALAKALGADVLVTGSVTLLGDDETIVDQARGVPGFKVKGAGLQLTRASDGSVLATANYTTQRDLPALAATYHDVARQLVEAVVRE